LIFSLQFYPTDRKICVFFPPQAKHRGCGTALTLPFTQRVLVFYAVHRESDWRAAINRNVLAGKCKLSAKPRFETMLLVRGRDRSVGRRPKSGPARAICQLLRKL